MDTLQVHGGLRRLINCSEKIDLGGGIPVKIWLTMAFTVNYKEIQTTGAKMFIFRDAKSLASGYAEWMLEYCTSRLKNKNNLHIALSGGSTPELLFAQLARQDKFAIPWHSLHLYWSDERCVPPEHPESNYRTAEKLLLRNINIPAENVHRIFGEQDPSAEALRYAHVLEKNVPLKSGIPHFDLIMLGMGDDGHTASIFPDQMNLLRCKETIAVAKHPFSRQQRISFSGILINNANCVSFLVSGSKKSTTLKAIWKKDPIAKQYPSSHIQTSGEVLWFCDEEASRNLV